MPPFPSRHRAPALALALLLGSAPAASAQGAPAAWGVGGKEGIGTSATVDSKLWFTLARGQVQEVFYPTIDVANVQGLEFIVVGPDGKPVTASQALHRTSLADERSLTYRQESTDKVASWRLSRTYAADPARATLLVGLRLEALKPGPYRLFVRYDPSLAGSGQCDTGSAADAMLLARDDGQCDATNILKGTTVASALAASAGLRDPASFHAGSAADGVADLLADGRLDRPQAATAGGGNLVQLAEVPLGPDGQATLALSFGPDTGTAAEAARASLSRPFDAVLADYQRGWRAYLDGLAKPPRFLADKGLAALYNVSVMGLKAHEDKTFPGANVASLSHPWGEAMDADQCCKHGYHAVWARDLYHVSTAQLALGDRAAAERSLDYLFTVQQKPDGSFPQNTRLDGTPIWGSLQMDEVAFPLLMAWQLGRTDAATWAKVKKSADFILDNGPDTPQERWEENSGASPSTIAAQVAGLVAAAEIARANGDNGSAARYLETADLWQSKVVEWTATRTGTIPGTDGSYFLRIARTGNPDKAERITITNGGGSHDQRAIVDQSFLELTRLGVLAPDHPMVEKSLAVTDKVIGRPAPGDKGGPPRLFYRYNHDGYGETADGEPYTGQGVGRLWPLLSGERGQYELQRGRDAMPYLLAMAATANDGLMLPEQVWDRDDGPYRYGQGTGSATPLAWSMAQFVRLALSIDKGAPVDLPSIVADRYGRKR